MGNKLPTLRDYIIMQSAALLFWQFEERKSVTKLGRVLPFGTVIFRDENSEPTWMYSWRVPEGSTRPSAPSGLIEKAAL